MLLSVDKINNEYVIHGIENYINPKLEHFKIDLSELKIVFENDLPTYKQLAEDAALERYEEKQNREIFCNVTANRIQAFKEKHGLTANSIEEILTK